MSINMSSAKALREATDCSGKTLAPPSQLLDHAIELVVERLRSKVKGLSSAQRKKLSKKLKKLLGEYDREKKALKQRQQEFIRKYDVKKLGKGQVQFTLPKGSSRLDLLNDAQALAPKLVGTLAIGSSLLEEWADDQAFTRKVGRDTKRAIDGNVKGSKSKTRKQQRAEGWNDVDMCDLAVAHAVYLIATKKDLFGGNMVRARGGTLAFIVFDGIAFVCGFGGYHDGACSSRLTASKSLLSRN